MGMEPALDAVVTLDGLQNHCVPGKKYNRIWQAYTRGMGGHMLGTISQAL